MQSIYRLISATLMLIIAVGSLPCLTCSSAVCAANVQCASVHCGCCGPNYPWQKNSHDSQKHSPSCNREQCPLVAASKSVTISPTRESSASMLGIAVAQPFITVYFAVNILPVHSISSARPDTLLSLGCALTV